VRSHWIFKLPFGEELGSDPVVRTAAQGYSAGDTNRWKYGMLQRDAATGLDHAGWRKYESFSGRWTSPDPLSGGIGNPQSFNHYAYAGNDPVNFIDPSGLDPTFTPRYPYYNHSPDPLFHDYMINAWDNGWNQMYGLNPISITFESDHGRGNDATWTAYTTITLGYGPPQNPPGSDSRDSLGVDSARVDLRCRHLRELLNREARWGTQEAALMSSSAGGSHSLYGLNNDAGAMIVNWKPIDQDWLVDLKAIVHDQGIERAKVEYTVAKGSWWLLMKLPVIGKPTSRPGAEIGEKNAVALAGSPAPFSRIFDQRFMAKVCPGY
jgi:RHS repeat-associated protein